MSSESRFAYFFDRCVYVTKRLARAQFDRLVFRYRYNRFSIVEHLVTIAGLATSTFSWLSANSYFTVAGALVAALGMIASYYNSHISRLVPLRTNFPKEFVEKNTTKILRNRNEYLYFDKALNVRLNGLKNTVEVMPGRYTLPLELHNLVGIILKNKKIKWLTTNELKIGLRTEITPKLLEGTDLKVQLQTTTYYEGVISNDTSTFTLGRNGFSGSLRDRANDYINFSRYAFENGQLVSLEISKSSNHIGGSTIAITRDGFILYQTQGKDNDIGASQLFPSASGSFDWVPELSKGDVTFRDLVLANLERELHEEIYVPSDENYTCISFLTGYGRVLQRGGKPEFYGLTLIDQLSTAVTVRPAEHGYVYNIQVWPLRDLRLSSVKEGLNLFYVDMLVSDNTGIAMIATLRCAIDFLTGLEDENWAVDQIERVRNSRQQAIRVQK